VKHLRSIAAGLAIAAAAVTGTTLATHNAAPRTDTTWSAPDTTADTTWGSEPVNLPVDLPTITPLDTTWG
jgi:hypothetical protein